MKDLTDNQDINLKINKRDIAAGLKSLMDGGEHNIRYSQKFLSSISNVSEAQISKLLDVDSIYTPTIATISKVLSVWNMTMMEFYKYIDDITFKR